MKIGDCILVEMIEQRAANKYQVKTLKGHHHGILTVFGQLHTESNGSVRVWIIEINPSQNLFYCGNSYFGRYPIPVSIRENYIRILPLLLEQPEQVTPEDISIIKGMLNRCVKHDQWDWYTTHQYLGHPNMLILKQSVSQCIHVRNALRQDDRTALYEFIVQREYMLKSIRFHLAQDAEYRHQEIDFAQFNLSTQEWHRLSFASKNNLKLISAHLNTPSVYLLIHVLRTLQNEFYAHLIQPFTDQYDSDQSCTHPHYERLETILTKNHKRDLSAIYYLGKMIDDSEAQQASPAILAFHEYLGDRSAAFKRLCHRISSFRIGDYNLTDLHKAIVHGHTHILAELNEDTFKDAFNASFVSEQAFIPSILRLSLQPC